MKKYFLIVVCALLLFVVTGCGNKNQLKCTGSMEDSGMKIEAEVVADFDENDKLTDATIVYDLGSSETASAWCSIFEYMKDADKVTLPTTDIEPEAIQTVGKERL